MVDFYIILSFIFHHSIPENPVIAYAASSGDSFIFHHSIPENPVIAYAASSGDSFIFRHFISFSFVAVKRIRSSVGKHNTPKMKELTTTNKTRGSFIRTIVYSRVNTRDSTK